MIVKVNPGEVVLYGASDDLIEVDSDGKGADEYDCYDDPNGRHVRFSDGTILHIHYNDDGLWKIKVVERGTAKLTIDVATDPDSDVYTDVARLIGDIDSWKVTKRKWTPK